MWIGEPHPFPERGSPTGLSASGQQSYEGGSCRTSHQKYAALLNESYEIQQTFIVQVYRVRSATWATNIIYSIKYCTQKGKRNDIFLLSSLLTILYLLQIHISVGTKRVILWVILSRMFLSYRLSNFMCLWVYWEGNNGLASRGVLLFLS